MEDGSVTDEIETRCSPFPPSGSLNLFSSKPGDGSGSSRFRLMSCSCSGAWSRRTRPADSPSLAAKASRSANGPFQAVGYAGSGHAMLDTLKDLGTWPCSIRRSRSHAARSPEHPCHGQGPGGKFESGRSFEQSSILQRTPRDRQRLLLPSRRVPQSVTHNRNPHGNIASRDKAFLRSRASAQTRVLRCCPIQAAKAMAHVLQGGFASLAENHMIRKG